MCIVVKFIGQIDENRRPRLGIMTDRVGINLLVPERVIAQCTTLTR
jgi:hypothetical protein